MADEKPFHNPFGALAALKSSLTTPASVAPAAARPQGEPPAPAGSRPQPRAVVRYERSGRGGKQVTVVEQLDLSDTERAEWLRALKTALGCGGVVEGDNLVLQGDQRKRLPGLLTARHVRRVTVS